MKQKSKVSNISHPVVGSEIQWDNSLFITSQTNRMELNQPIVELPVADVEKAQEYYRDVLDLKIEWITPGKLLGAVSSGETALFFRKKDSSATRVASRLFTEDVDDLYQQMKGVGADIVEEVEDKPWGLRQFTIKDVDGNIFYVFHG